MDDIRVINQVNEKVFHPVSLGFVLVVCFLILFLRRRYFFLPFIFTAILVSEAQRITLLGVGFNAMRIMIVFGLLRILLRRETPAQDSVRLDRTIVLWALAAVCLNTLRAGTTAALVNRAGFVLSALGTYFLFRVYFTSLHRIELAIMAASLAAGIVAVAMVAESQIGRNIFSVFGGVPELAAIREGRIRSQGPFAHPILAGTFGATLLPLFVALLQRKGLSRAVGVLGTVSALAIVGTSASSGPVVSLLAALLGLLMWVIRDSMKQVRWMLLLSLIGLEIVMKAPVYALIARVDVVGGSTGYHRYLLIDAFVKNFRGWILFGSDRAAFWGWGLQDVTNQYVLEGLSGGIAQFLLFIMMIVRAFRGTGKGLELAVSCHGTDRFFIWTIGASIFAHVVSFISVSYFDQVITVWYMVLAMAASCACDERVVDWRERHAGSNGYESASAETSA